MTVKFRQIWLLFRIKVVFLSVQADVHCCQSPQAATLRATGETGRTSILGVRVLRPEESS